MKGTTFLATAIAAGTASAGVHKMPLKKVPLSKQLVSSTARPMKTVAAIDTSSGERQHW